MQKYLASYADLHNPVTELVFHLKEVDEESSEKILELLICLDCIPNLLSEIFLKANKDEMMNDEDSCCLSVIFNLLTKQMNSRYYVASLALKLVKTIYQVGNFYFIQFQIALCLCS